MDKTLIQWKAIFWHERFDAEEQRLIYIVAEDEQLATDEAWQALANLMDEEKNESIADFYLVEISEQSHKSRWKVRLDHIYTDEEKYFSVLADSEKEAVEAAFSLARSENLDTTKWDAWECKKIPPGGKRTGAGRPPGRTTRPIRIPLENIDKAQNLDVALDILREWKLRSSLNQKSARFYFLDQAIEELEKHWGEI